MAIYVEELFTNNISRMNFKAYDILVSLVPGYVALLYLLHLLHIPYDKDMVIAYTALAFVTGYLMNSISSWLEGIYFFTWGGIPSSKLLDGEDIWKVRFSPSDSAKIKAALLAECGNANASHDELFQIAMRHANNQSSRLEDFNAQFGFSRVLLTTVLLGTIVLLAQHYQDWRYYAVLLPSLFITWLRCKQRSYYYAKEVLNTYMKIKGL